LTVKYPEPNAFDNPNPSPLRVAVYVAVVIVIVAPVGPTVMLMFPTTFEMFIALDPALVFRIEYPKRLISEVAVPPSVDEVPAGPMSPVGPVYPKGPVAPVFVADPLLP
jgi:hypothetical protein